MAWKICCALVVALSLLTFTPLVIPAGVFEPTLWGVPRSLWAGLLVSLAYAGLTLAGTLVHPGFVREDAPIDPAAPRGPDTTRA